MRKPLAIIATALVATAGGAGVAAAATGAATPPADRAREAAFTARHVARAKVTRADAEATALRVHPGTATDTHLQNEGEGLRWEVKPDDGKKLWEVQIDAKTGRVVSDQGDE